MTLSPDNEDSPPAGTAASTAARIGGVVAGGLGLLLLAASVAWWVGESEWGRYQQRTPEQAFADGTFGLELAPLKYILVSSRLSAAAFELPDHRPWPQRFGFLSRSTPAAGSCEADAPGNLPVGFSVSHRLPGNATPVPVRFVGLTCAACHAASIGSGAPILGVGSQTADVIGFSDAFLNAVLDANLTADAILDAYDQQCPPQGIGLLVKGQRLIERFFIDSWLQGARAAARSNASKYDQPFHGAQIGDPANIPTGPSRTRPFRSVVRNTLDLPGENNHAYSKVPLAALQADKVWSQFDGSIGKPVVRSLIAVFTSGASIAALNERQIADDVVQAADYTLRLGLEPRLPTLAQAFPTLPVPALATLERGRAVYLQHCDGCHGHPEPGGWVMPPGLPVPSIAPLKDIGTDPARLEFRYADMLPVALATTLPARDIGPQLAALEQKAAQAASAGALAEADWWTRAIAALQERARVYPTGHRMAFAVDEIARRDGFENAPIPFAWLRAPYLHNASVPTLRALIGLDERPALFCRGQEGYDPVAIGTRVVLPPHGGTCPPEAPFLFDAGQPGNSNGGHIYPPRGTGSDDLEALLAYIGTL